MRLSPERNLAVASLSAPNLGTTTTAFSSLRNTWSMHFGPSNWFLFVFGWSRHHHRKNRKTFPGRLKTGTVPVMARAPFLDAMHQFISIANLNLSRAVTCEKAGLRSTNVKKYCGVILYSINMMEANEKRSLPAAGAVHMPSIRAPHSLKAQEEGRADAMSDMSNVYLLRGSLRGSGSNKGISPTGSMAAPNATHSQTRHVLLDDTP